MKKWFLAFFLVTLLSKLHAQQVNFEWAMHAGASLTDGAYSVTTDAAGNVYSTGEFKGTVDFDPGPGIYNMTAVGNGSNAFILKLSPAGNFIWVKQVQQITNGDNIGGNIVIDATGAIYYSVQLFGMVDADPGPLVSPLGTSTSFGESFITKLDASGNFLWAGIFGGANSGITDMQVDQAGNVYATGFFQFTVDFDPGAGTYPLTSNGFTDIFVLKLNTNGNLLWAGAMGAADGDYAYSIAVSNAGEVYFTGFFIGTVDFDPGSGVYNLSAPGVTNSFIAKLNSNGNFVWAEYISGNSSNLGFSITVDNNNNILVAGGVAGTADFDPGPGTSNYTSAGSLDIYVLKLDAGGNFIWVKQVGGTSIDGTNAIVTDQQGNAYLTGYFSSTVDFDPGPGTASLTPVGGNDVYVLKLSTAGNFDWVKHIAGTGSSDYGISLFVDAAYSVYVSGYYGGTADFDPGAAVYDLSSNGGQDAYLLKLSKCTQVFNTTLNITECNSYTLNGQTYNSSGTYTQTLITSLGCDSIITLNLTIGRKFTAVNAAICDGQTYFAGGANQTTAGIYKDTLFTTTGCDSIITTTLTVNPKPKPDLGPDRKLCVSSSTFITPGIFAGYLWQDNSTAPVFNISSTGDYWVTVTDANNCQAADTMKVLAIDTVPRNFLPPNQSLCYGNELKISVPGYKDYSWSTGSTSPDITINNFGSFYLNITDFNDCKGSDTITLRRSDCIFIGIPNAFTPDNNGLNDVLRPTINQAIRAYSFMVFNRYGEKIFATTDYSKGWDGTYKGKQQVAGSYVYRITYTNIFGYTSEEKGSVLLIR